MSATDPIEPNEHATADVVLAEVRGLASTMSARFDGVEREQGAMNKRIDRIADAVNQQAQLFAKMTGVETRLGGVEGDQSDLSLEVAGLRDRMEKVEKDAAKTQMVRSGTLAAASSVFTAVVMFVSTHLKF